MKWVTGTNSPEKPPASEPEAEATGQRFNESLRRNRRSQSFVWRRRWNHSCAFGRSLPLPVLMRV
jgi:hypothetical protein